MTGIAKRSITIRGHRTSISLEDAFWHELRQIAAETAQSLTALITEIDEKRGGDNLSSALRLAVLAHLQRKAAAAITAQSTGLTE